MQGSSKWSGNISGQADRLEKLTEQLVMMSRLDEIEVRERVSRERIDLKAAILEEWKALCCGGNEKVLRMCAAGGWSDCPRG